MKSLILGLVSFILVLDCAELVGQKDRTLDFFIYAGIQQQFIHGSGVEILDPNIIDRVHPYSDSIRLLPSFSFHTGAALSVDLICNLNLSIGLEWNLRKSFLKLYGDSISATGNPIPSYNIEHTLSHNLEIPIYLSYNLKRFGIGGGIKGTLLEFSMQKKYSEDMEVSKSFSFAHFPRPLADKILYPIAYIEYLVFSGPKIPLLIRASYEFGNYNSSVIYLSLQTKF